MSANIEILSGEQLFALTEEPENRDLFSYDGVSRRIEFLWNEKAPYETHITALIDGRIVGICAIEDAPHRAGDIMMKFVSIEEDFHGQGISRQLVDALFGYVLANGLVLHPSSFGPMGRERLLHMFEAFAAQHPQAICSEWGVKSCRCFPA